MKEFALSLIFSLSALAGWGPMESDEYRFFVQKRNLAATGLPIPPDTKPAVGVFVTAKEGTAKAVEHRVTMRFVGADGKTYRQTLAATPNPAGGFYAIFDVDALNVLSVDIERVNPPIIQEAQ